MPIFAISEAHSRFFFFPALYENARREEAQMFQMQQWLQYGVGPEETHRGLWENLPVHMWMPVCK